MWDRLVYSTPTSDQQIMFPRNDNSFLRHAFLKFKEVIKHIVFDALLTVKFQLQQNVIITLAAGLTGQLEK